MYYGFLIGDGVVYLPNFIGAAIGMYCIFAYEAMSMTSNRIIYGAVACVSLIASYFAYQEDTGSLGYLGIGLAAVVTLAPMASLGTVMKERSTAAIPFGPTIMSLFNALSWTLYGFLIAKDIMVRSFLHNCTAL